MPNRTNLSASQPALAIIFDFDGTIADSFAVFVRVAEKILKRERPFSETEIGQLRQLPLKEIMRELGIKKWQLPGLVMKGRREVDRRMEDVAAFADMPDVLRKLSNHGHKVFIVSSHSPEGIHVFLTKYGVEQSVTQTYGNVGLWSKSKTLKKLRQQHGLLADQCIYIGDEVRDIVAATKADMSCIAVGWGFNAPSALKLHKPAALVDQPEKLIAAIENLGAKL